ncbi:MAG: FAD-dependent oxidoreductase [Coriobacteriia bacterium]|nr:FAD-dependent oxidoreductase [Coriobacteriia bacterium]MBS5478126.1 FAD-dependent oxidoreductase [Coriobacteriia bacterium]
MERKLTALGSSLSRRQVIGGALAAAATASLFSLNSRAFASDKAGASAAADGTYEATKPGMNAGITVSVTITDGKIADVQVTSHEETRGIGGPLADKNGTVVTEVGASPVELIPQLIVENNSLAVDMVTGATITSASIVSAVKDCIEQAGGNPDDFAAEVSYPTREDTTADVVVVGGGGAGLAAAIVAAQQGKNVVILEKNGECGGDTLVCGAIYNCPDEALQSVVEMTDAVKTTIEKALEMTSDDPDKQKALEEMQAPVREQWEEYKASGRTDLFDTKEWYALQTWINGDMVANPELVKVLTYNAYDGLQWLEDVDMEFADSISQGAGSLWQRTHTSKMQMGTGFISTYSAQLGKFADQIAVYTEATGTELVVEDGKVVGVVATDNHSGSTFTVSATDGVILSTGGFAANSKMVQENNDTGKWPDLSDTASTNRFTCSQGDGITMAKAVGASTTDMDQIQLLYLGNLVDDQLTKYPPRCANGVDQLIFVNKNGERFVQEDGRRDQICLAVIEQPGAYFYMLESGDGAGYVDIKSPEWQSADGFSFQYLEENGYIVWDDTLEGLAGKLEMDPATLQATVDAFNAAVDAGSDEFGRTLFSTKLENGPWVVTGRQACVHHTMGGLTIDTEARVLDESGAPIAGLYAAGEVTGGIHGGNRLGGNAVVDTVVFGKLSADTLVADHK